MLLLDSALSELRLLTVSTLQLLPTEDAAPPPDSFSLSPQLMRSFEAFLPKRRAAVPAPPAALAAPVGATAPAVAVAVAAAPTSAASAASAASAPAAITGLHPALESSFLFGLLQTRALKALQGLLRVESSKAFVLDGGLLPSLLASAAMPVPLVGLHQTEVLQTHVAMLEQVSSQ